MKSISATAKVILDKRRIKKNGTYPLSLRITSQSKRIYYNINEELSLEQFEKMESPKLRETTLKEIKLRNEAIEAKANEIIKSLNLFDFGTFEKLMFPKNEIKFTNNVYDLFNKYINELTQENRISTANSYKNALNSFRKFSKKLSFEEVTPEFLKEYENWMISHENSSTTIGFYTRNLRAIYNQSIELKLVSQENYPFGKNKFVIPASRNIKKALTKEDVKKIYNYQTMPKSSQEKAKDFWLFSYVCNGMNIKDICQLKWKDFDGKTITLVRAKTSLSKKSNQKPIEIPVNDLAQNIISKWGTTRNSNSYLFPIFDANMNETQKYHKKNTFVKFVNKYINEIGKELGIEKKISTYSARHSFSTIMLHNGANLIDVSEALGHSNLKTTQSYIDSISSDQKQKYAEKLIDFD